jgi:CHAT domain-containing protein
VAVLDFDAELTVLSACNTGNGEYFAGERLMGMGRAFRLASLQQVVVSLWPVDSHSMERLMTLFDERLVLDETAEVALWQAQCALQNEGGRDGSGGRGIALSGGRIVGEDDAGSRYANPFQWSPFVLVSTR